MKNKVYFISALILAACSPEGFSEKEMTPVTYGASSQIRPGAYMNPADLPPAATKALVGAESTSEIKANVLRIDEIIDGDNNGTYTYERWDNAYLIEADISSVPLSDTYLRTISLNPVQSYRFNVDGDNDTTFYHTRMVSWYPLTCPLHKNDEGKAVVTKFSDFKETIDETVYELDEDGNIVLRFADLDGSKDVMVSNVVEGQHWHSKDDGEEHYVYPFGHNEALPKYSNNMTYKHYLSAIKVYAYTDNSAQEVSMWGALRNVIVKNQPSELLVQLPSVIRSPVINDYVQENFDFGKAEFSNDVRDIYLHKTPVFGEHDNSAENQEIAEDSPELEPGKRTYLGYALIKPYTEEGQELSLDIHTDAGVLAVSIPMEATVDGNKVNYFEPGFIYTIDVKFNTEGAIADIVMKSGEEHYYDLTASMEFGEDIHDYQYANCYIVSPDIKKENGDEYDGYAFSATIVGNGALGVYSSPGFDRTSPEIEPVRAGLLWESSQGLITHVEYLYGYVRFKVTDINEEGNAVIAVYDSQRKVLWSWHIWITDRPKDVTHKIGESEIIIMDRNLGATSDSKNELLDTYGLYYQWGRKDPSMGAKTYNYLPQSTETADYYDYYGMLWNYAGVVNLPQPTVRDGVENPMYLILPTDFSMTTYQYDWLYTHVDNLWGDYDHSSSESTSQRQKTIYDPCPFGYMVPQDEISSLFADSNVSIDGKGMSISGKVGDVDHDSFFPYAGYKGVDKGVSSLSSAWRYVGQKGDYMSSKIEDNGHRSRTYISYASSWVEYGADSDNDGDGDASRTYNTQISADDVANRRTAASVRCVKRTSALNTSLYASFIGDKTYAFVGDEDIIFDYNIKVYGSGASIVSSVIETSVNGADYQTSRTLDAEDKTDVQGTESFALPETAGIARYRLVTTSSTGAVSQVGYVLRLFDISDMMVGGVQYSSGIECEYGQTYTISFDLKGTESDFKVLVNGKEATKISVDTDANGVATMKYSISGAYIPGHIHIQILDADGGQACSKNYEVNMSKITSYSIGDNIDNVGNLEAGALYMIKTYSGKARYLTNNSGKLVLSTTSTPSPENIFLFHRNNTRAGGVSANYRNVCAGAWLNLYAYTDGEGEADGFIKEDLTFGPESEAAYMTCANGWNSASSNDIDLYLENTGQFFYYNGDNLSWGIYGNYYSYKWIIYKVTVE